MATIRTPTRPLTAARILQRLYLNLSIVTNYHIFGIVYSKSLSLEYAWDPSTSDVGSFLFTV